MDVTRLRSGREVLIRPIRPADQIGLRAAHDRLSPESKYSRFLAPKPYLTAADARYLVQIDGDGHVALVATPVDDPDYILAVARFVRLTDESQTAEFAIVVGDRFHREGLGTALLERLSEFALQRGIVRFRATMFAGNAAAHRLVAAVPGRRVLLLRVGAVDEVEIELAEPRPSAALSARCGDQADLAA
jgi:RimJ/RimL family protein N-acetyltransferase